MKKKLLIGLSILLVAIIIGIIVCMNLMKLDTITCKNSIKEDNYTINNTYTIYYKKKDVKKVRIEKEIISKNNTILSFFAKNYEEEYDKYNKEYGGYTIKTKDGKSKKTVMIEWTVNKAKLEKLQEKRSYLKENINKNHIDIDGIYKMFQLSKNICNEKVSK